MQAELSIEEKKLLIDRESEQAEAQRNAPANKVIAQLDSLEKDAIDESEEDKEVNLKKIAYDTQEQMDRVVTLC